MKYANNPVGGAYFMKKYCEKCGKDVSVTTKKRKEIYKVKDIDVQITALVTCCDNCGNEIWDDDKDNDNLIEAFNQYRKIKGLLFPAEIKEIRQKYGMTQSNFAKILGFGEKTITRYENGSLQDPAQNNLIFLISDPLNFKILWEKNKILLSKEDQAHTEICLNKLISPQRSPVKKMKLQYPKLSLTPNSLYQLQYGNQV